MSVPSFELGPPTPSPVSECVPPELKGGTHSPVVRGWGRPNSDDWRKSLALCLLCEEKSREKVVKVKVFHSYIVNFSTNISCSCMYGEVPFGVLIYSSLYLPPPFSPQQDGHLVSVHL